MFTIIGDVHGCFDELCDLVEKTGFWENKDTLVFCGDLTDRGPANRKVLFTAMTFVESGHAKVVLGNHDDKLRRWLRGNKVKVGHGLDGTIEELEKCSDKQRGELSDFLESLPYKLVLDNGKLFVSHAGCPENLQDVDNKKSRSTCLYGKTTGKTLANGYPERLDWAEDYKGARKVVHGHVVTKKPVIKNGVYNIDTGCVFGGYLTAIKYPSMEIVQVKARQQYAQHKEICFT